LKRSEINRSFERSSAGRSRFAPVPKLPRITGAKLVRILKKAGFTITRQRGSHVQLRREEPNGSVTTFPVPVHAGKDLKKGTLKGILRKAGMDMDDLAGAL
jgi:predicted RNA binding protein YcfA (HicA-like mRNA interferase family)